MRIPQRNFTIFGIKKGDPKVSWNYSKLNQPMEGAVRATGVDSEAARSRGKL
tara:strand:- start:32 stop:187 length:156 start_codon:yes stop_codon:yes gene_type:complete